MDATPIVAPDDLHDIKIGGIRGLDGVRLGFQQSRQKKIGAGLPKQVDIGRIGLAVARSVLELQHGSLQMSSQEGQGSTFHIRLPAAR